MTTGNQSWRADRTAADRAIYFLSDYGTADEFVGVVHSVLWALAPGIPVIDLTHGIAPFDVLAGAETLVRCAPSMGPGVVLAVVDPGVGTERRGVAVEVGQPETAGSGDVERTPTWLVGPDNGLLVPLTSTLGSIATVIDLAGTGSGTFDGRDTFAPAAAHLVTGGPPDSLGVRVEPDSLVTPPPASPERFEPAVDVLEDARPFREGSGPTLVTTVASIDRFGNVQLRATPDSAQSLGGVPGAAIEVLVPPDAASVPGRPLSVTGGDGGIVGATRRTASVAVRRVAAFGELALGELGLLVDASGHLALVARQSSAAQLLGLARSGATVQLRLQARRTPARPDRRRRR